MSNAQRTDFLKQGKYIKSVKKVNGAQKTPKWHPIGPELVPKWTPNPALDLELNSGSSTPKKTDSSDRWLHFDPHIAPKVVPGGRG